MSASFFEYLGWVSLSRNLKESFNRTLKGALHRRHAIIEIEHLLTALVDDPEAAIVLNAMGVDRERLRDELIARLDELPQGGLNGSDSAQPSRELKKLMAKASDIADRGRDEHVDGGDVVKALMGFEGSPAARVLQQLARRPATNGESRQARLLAGEARTVQAAARVDTGAGQGDAAMPLGFDVDPIRASIKAIMARRTEAEQILNQCEWYHLFKSLNRIEDGLEPEELTHRAKLLARAERELAERPRCRKAFLYMRHLDQELARLKGIVDTDWTDAFSPDEAVAKLASLREEQGETESYDDDHASFVALAGEQAEIERQLSNVRMQETEVLALERQLEKLGHSGSRRARRISDLESQLDSYGEHGRKRSTAIAELEHFLREEVMQSEAREKRIRDLERDLAEKRGLSEELEAHRAKAGDSEKRVFELEQKLAEERDTAVQHGAQIEEMRRLLVEEKGRAEDHGRQMVDLQAILDAERNRALQHEQQVQRLESDLATRLEQLQEREEQIRSLQENLNRHETLAKGREEHVKLLEAELHGHENRALTREEQVKRLRAELAEREHSIRSKEEALQKLEVGLATQEAEGTRQQREIDLLRVSLATLEMHQQKQEAAFISEKATMEQLIEELRESMKGPESLIEIIRGPNEPYRISRDFAPGREGLVQIVSRRTIPVAVKRQHNE